MLLLVLFFFSGINLSPKRTKSEKNHTHTLKEKVSDPKTKISNKTRQKFDSSDYKSESESMIYGIKSEIYKNPFFFFRLRSKQKQQLEEEIRRRRTEIQKIWNENLLSRVICRNDLYSPLDESESDMILCFDSSFDRSIETEFSRFFPLFPNWDCSGFVWLSEEGKGTWVWLFVSFWRMMEIKYWRKARVCAFG